MRSWMPRCSGPRRLWCPGRKESAPCLVISFFGAVRLWACCGFGAVSGFIFMSLSGTPNVCSWPLL